MNGIFSVTMHHLRPIWWICIWAHFLAGSIMTAGSGLTRLPLEDKLRVLLAGGLWAMCLGGAAAALSATLAPRKPDDLVPPHRSVAWVGLALMLVGLAASPALSWWYFDLYLVGIILVVLYASPPLQLARWPWSAAVAEGAGVGALTFLAGRVILGIVAIPERPLILYFSGFALTIFAVRVLLSREMGGLMPVLYVVCLVGAFGCFMLGRSNAEPRRGVVLLLTSLGGWCVLGACRYWRRSDSAASRKSKTAVPVGWVVLMCLLTDAVVVANDLATRTQP